MIHNPLRPFGHSRYRHTRTASAASIDQALVAGILLLLSVLNAPALIQSMGNVETNWGGIGPYLVIGNTNAGLFSVTDGSQLVELFPNQGFYVIIGAEASASSLSIYGTNSLVQTWYRVFVGQEGTNNVLNVKQGGTLLGDVSTSWPSKPIDSYNHVFLGDPGSSIVGGVQLLGRHDELVIENGGILSGGFALLGEHELLTIHSGGVAMCSSASLGDFALALITDTNSILTSGSYLNVGGVGITLIATNGARIEASAFGTVGSGSNNLISISGQGTSASLGSVILGGTGDQLAVTNGATMDCTALEFRYAERNLAAISGPTSRLAVNAYLWMTGTSNCMQIISGGQTVVGREVSLNGRGQVLTISGSRSSLVVPTNTVYVGDALYPANVPNYLEVGAGGRLSADGLTVDGASSATVAGDLFITNASNTANIFVGWDAVLTNRGAIQANSVVLNGVLEFPEGSLRTAAFVTHNLAPNSPGPPVFIGQGTNPAAYFMEGGTHTFLNGVVISSNSVLSGCGRVVGAVTNYGTILLTNHCDIIMSGSVVNYGTILALNGALNFESGFTNYGTFFQNTARITGLAISAPDVLLQVETVTNLLHDVQAQNAPFGGEWISVTNGLVGDGGIMGLVDPRAATNSLRVYRVLLHYP